MTIFRSWKPCIASRAVKATKGIETQHDDDDDDDDPVVLPWGGEGGDKIIPEEMRDEIQVPIGNWEQQQPESQIQLPDHFSPTIPHPPLEIKIQLGREYFSLMRAFKELGSYSLLRPLLLASKAGTHSESDMFNQVLFSAEEEVGNGDDNAGTSVSLRHHRRSNGTNYASTKGCKARPIAEWIVVFEHMLCQQLVAANQKSLVKGEGLWPATRSRVMSRAWPPMASHVLYPTYSTMSIMRLGELHAVLTSGQDKRFPAWPTESSPPTIGNPLVVCSKSACQLSLAK
ncbi:hypothetical protein ACRALDRAFT_207064 [Sodiomyces alcalophilus JCM 7366]|uniref:uncharacterized protein n=1 Tax=Sodiomyces alcalophilus JCM 7366 TaxID=591952 RepID=UPI0039B3D8A8